jgi:hypothetical protein
MVFVAAGNRLGSTAMSLPRLICRAPWRQPPGFLADHPSRGSSRPRHNDQGRGLLPTAVF